MKNLQVVEVLSEGIKFNDGTILKSDHDRDCCEHHWLAFDELSIDDFEGLVFDISGDNFFNKIEEYGIEILPINGHPVRIAGHGYNNGYYSTNIDLLVIDGSGDVVKTYDVSECQVIQD
jgi:hypothetical protein